VRGSEQQIDRIGRGIVQCQEVIDVPRRLGGDATDKELADDKRIARRVKFRLEEALREWVDEPMWAGLPTPDGSGARLDWAAWWAAWRVQGLAVPAANLEIHRVQRELDSLSQIFAELR
jgi:hypothetical protein